MEYFLVVRPSPLFLSLQFCFCVSPSTITQPLHILYFNPPYFQTDKLYLPLPCGPSITNTGKRQEKLDTYASQWCIISFLFSFTLAVERLEVKEQIMTRQEGSVISELPQFTFAKFLHIPGYSLSVWPPVSPSLKKLHYLGLLY